MLRSLLFTLVFYVHTGIFLVLGSPLLFCPRSWAMAGLKLHALTSLWWLKVIVGMRLEVRGRERLPSGPLLAAAKHQSAWDTFGLVPLFDDPAFVLKAELLAIPFYGWFCRKFAHIAVKRRAGAAALRQMIRDAETQAKRGRQILIFPEGTRRPPGALPDYKPGVVTLYESLALPCVPVALNSGVFWPRRSLLRRPGTIVVEMLDPIPPGLERGAFRALLENRLETACNGLLAEAAAAGPAAALPQTADEARTISEHDKNIKRTFLDSHTGGR